MTKVAILVPGIMGSVLMRGKDVIWPGPVKSLLFEYKLMKELMLPDLVATDCIRTYFFQDQYQSLIDDLAECGFREDDKTLIIGAYDWRKDNALSAGTLAGHIEKAVADHGADVDISIVAHSMGGLVGRYYLESGAYDQAKGYKNVRRLLTLATPHQGAALALPLVLGYEKRLFLSREQVLEVVSSTRFQGAYQLLPPRGEPFAWSGAAGEELAPQDIYDNAVGAKLGLVDANVQAAQRFHSKLGRRPSGVRYFCFAGTQHKTAIHALIRESLDPPLAAAKAEQEDGGDGTVPTWSAFLPGVQRIFVGGEHGTIYQDGTLRRVLATLLGKPQYLRGVPRHVEASLREKVVEPKDLVHASIVFGKGLEDFAGFLTIDRAILDPAGERVIGFGKPIVTHAVEYKGLGLETMSLVFEAPNVSGVYRVSFRDELDAEPSGDDQLIVQEPPDRVMPTS